MDVFSWLKNLGLGQYVDSFRMNSIDAEVLPTLTDSDLVALGVVPLGHRKKILKAISKIERVV
jgi:hypothetical protein